MVCKLCQERVKQWIGDDPRCAFPAGAFNANNWNCSTANEIRKICTRIASQHFCNDQWYAIIPLDDIEIDDALCLWVSWYKHRGSTEAMWLLNEHGEPRRPTEKECQAIIKVYDLA